MSGRTNGRKSVAYHPRSRLERRRGGARGAGAARSLPADRDAARRRLGCRRRRRRACARFILSRFSTSPIWTPSRAVRRTRRRCRGCAPCRSRRNCGWMPASPMRKRSPPRFRNRCCGLYLGSESQRDEALLRRFRDHPGLILSLDFFADGFRGPPSILARPELWPQRMIVMTLAKVGSAAGPDFARLEEVKARAGTRAVIAAGGRARRGRYPRTVGTAESRRRWSPPRCTTILSRPSNSRCSAPEFSADCKARRANRPPSECFKSPRAFSTGATDHPARQMVLPVRGCLLSKRRTDASPSSAGQWLRRQSAFHRPHA